jgi:hypothetical protein
MKYLIYKGTGGLVHMLNGLQNAVLLAKKEKRTLIIDTINTGAFKQTFNTYFYIYDDNLNYICDYDSIHNENKKDLYFENIHINDIQFKGTKLIDGKYYLADSDICVQDTIGKKNKILRVYAGYSQDFIQNLKLNQSILEFIYEKCHHIIDNYKKYISVHFRNTDMKNNIQHFIQKIKKISQKHNIQHIFVATDDAQAFNTFQSSLKELHFFKLFDVPNCNGKNIHYHHSNKKEIVQASLIDLYMIGKSNYFIPSKNSGFSKWIIYQKNNIKHNIFDENFYFKVVHN